MLIDSALIERASLHAKQIQAFGVLYSLETIYNFQENSGQEKFLLVA